VRPKILAIALIVLGVGSTLAGLYGQVFLAEDEGHHDGRAFSFALESASGADELIAEPVQPNLIRVGVERAGQSVELDKIHGGPLQIFVVSDDLNYFSHVSPGGDAGVRSNELAETGTAEVAVPGGDLRVIVQASPSGGPDLLELGASVTVEGNPAEAQTVSDSGEWTDGVLTVRRQGFDFVLSEAWNGKEIDDGPALLTLVRSEDFAFTHGHAQTVGDDRFSFALDLPGPGDYLAALEFEQNSELVTALFRLTI
jgi:hypothetical protein